MIASRRLNFLIRKFGKNSELEKEYRNFLEEYENLGHISEVKGDSRLDQGFFLPHHTVIKQDGGTTKTRVVFDGSAKSSSGISLNECMMTGPPLQNDLFSLLLRFRSHRIVLTADIEKMYRQILVHPEDTVHQKLMFQKNYNEPVKTFALNTVK